jgi:uncharacterized protein YggE
MPELSSTPSVSGSSPPSQPVLSVRGYCLLEVSPELAEVTVTAIARGTGRARTTEQLADRHATVQRIVAALGTAVEQTSTSGLSVHVQLDDARKEQVRRFVGRASTEVIVNDFDVLSRLLTEVGEIDLVQLDGPQWRLRRDSDVYRQARIGAATDARRRARDYADAFGATVTGVVEISDLGMMSSYAEPVQALAAFGPSHRKAPRAGDGPTRFDLSPALQRVTGELEVRFTMSQPDPAMLTGPTG